MHEVLASHTRELHTPSSSVVSTHPQPHWVTKQSPQALPHSGPFWAWLLSDCLLPKGGAVALWLHLQYQLDTYMLSTCTRVNTGLIFLVSSNINYPILLSPILAKTSQKA